MQIHELPSASPSASDYIPIDNGTATRKATLSSIDMGSNEITFTSGDTSSPSSWQTVAVMASNTAANLMNAISKMVANIRWLYNRLGTSSTGTTATTVTGAIAEHSTKIGSAEMGTTATTLTGAIAEHENDITTLNSNINTITYFNCTADGSYYTISRQNCYAIGKRIFVSVELVVATASPPTTTGVFIIPSEYRPMSALSGKGFISRKNGMTIIDLRPALISIDTNGAVKQGLSSNISAGENIVIWAEYMLT